MAKFDVNNVSVESLLGYVKDGTIAIPEIQRPFVWDTTKVRDLMDSLYNEYPVGYIITWKSPDVKLKDGSASEGKQILIDGAVVSQFDFLLSKGDLVQISKNPVSKVKSKKQLKIPPIIYEDDEFLVINKPSGLLSISNEKEVQNTACRIMMDYVCLKNPKNRIYVVHRIDKDTSGLLVVAKDNETHLALSEQFACHSITRVYHTVVYGGFPADEGFVEGMIARHPADRKRMAVVHDKGKYAYTSYHVEGRYQSFTHLSVRLKTGRTHQIRVHMASIGHPVAGDSVYGPRKVITQLQGQCLHAKVLGFVHPATGKYVEFDSELPVYFREFLSKLAQKTGG